MDKMSIRRKLLRGSLSAPVVLTVSSPSTAAAASFAQCVKGSSFKQTYAFFTQDQMVDNWYRKSVQVSKLIDPLGQDQGFFFLDQGLNVYVSVTNPTYKLTFGTFLAPGWQITEQSQRWALLWFDQKDASMYPKITVQQPWQYWPATYSCYGSFVVKAA
jgi:hypothetical protein